MIAAITLTPRISREKTSVPISIIPATPIIGAEITGVDLAHPLDDETFEAVRKALVKHSVIVFPNQSLTPEEQIDFSRRFGPLTVHVLKDALLDGHPEIYRLSNVKKGGKVQGRSYAGQYWHSDLTYELNPSMGSVLYGIEVPDCGGDTLFASTAHAFETLSDPMKTMLEGLTAEHLFSHAFRGGTSPSARKGDPLNERPAVEHPVVRIHPESGRKCLFVNEGFTTRIKCMTPAESKIILSFLHAHTTRSEVVYRHKWRNGDVVVWDNRSSVHRGVGDYGDVERRHMHRTTIEDAA